MLQTFDKIENMEPPGPIKLHHTIESRSGTGVQVRLHEAPGTKTQATGAPSFNLGNFDLGPPRKECVGDVGDSYGGGL